MKIYIGNLSTEVTQEEIQKAFEAHGKVSEVNLITDRYSGRSRGFAFVEMPVATEGQTAIKALNGKSIGNQAVNVSEAKPREERGFGARRPGGAGSNFGGQRR